MKPYYIKNFIQKKILNWHDVEILLFLSNPKDIETIDENQNKFYYDKNNERKNSLIISNAKKYKKEFSTIINYLQLKDNIKCNKWDAHVYVSYNQGKSFKKHQDLATNYIIQCEGQSRWIVEDSFDIILNPGDMIFIPSSWFHQCEPMGKRISVSLPIWV